MAACRLQQGDKSQLSIANHILRLGAKGRQMEARRLQQGDKSQLSIANYILWLGAKGRQIDATGRQISAEYSKLHSAAGCQRGTN